MFTRQDYDTLHSLVFQDGYPGYRKEVKEIPNGDGKVDRDKRYAHVATKYLGAHDDGPATLELLSYLHRAHALALDVARALGVPADFMPRVTECALRVLEYPAGVGGHAHTDFDLFTLSLYRSEPARLKLARPGTYIDGAQLVPDKPYDRLIRARELNRGLHIGELGELIGLGEATRHHVEPSTETQFSIVYFALPSPDAVLEQANGRVRLTAGEWLAERYARSRVAA
jgi:hypothetical protein